MTRILITEDDPLMAEIYRDNFDGEGFSAEIASDGLIAIQRLKQNPPDLVLLDLMLPKLNGVEVLKFIRSQEATRSVPVIVMSNAYASELGDQARAAGATKCLPKNGCGPKRMLEEVRDALAAAAQPAVASVVPIAPVVPVTVVAAPVVVDTAARAGPATSLVSDQPKTNFNHAVLERMPQRLAELRQCLEDLTLSDQATRLPCLLELFRTVHGLAGATAFTGLKQASQFSAALESLLKELHAKPQKFTFSGLRTITQAVELLEPLVQRTAHAHDDAASAPLILVLNDDPASRETICTALDQAHLRAISLGDPAVALKLLEENHFALIFVDAQMAGADSFELCREIHALPANPNTPVVFITAASEFEARMLSASGPGIDFIAKPILLIEIAVKALTYLLRAHCKLTN
jgi:CheY-like chemotaxis protein